VTLSAVCFRYRPNDRSAADLNALNAELLRQVVRRGHVYLSNASLGGQFALRACFVNHRTRTADVDRIVPEVLSALRSVLGSRD
jgi:hypothetical protein